MARKSSDALRVHTVRYVYECTEACRMNLGTNDKPKIVRFGTNDPKELERHIQACGNVFPAVAALVAKKVAAGQPAVMPPPPERASRDREDFMTPDMFPDVFERATAAQAVTLYCGICSQAGIPANFIIEGSRVRCPACVAKQNDKAIMTKSPEMPAQASVERYGLAVVDLHVPMKRKGNAGALRGSRAKKSTQGDLRSEGKA